MREAIRAVLKSAGVVRASAARFGPSSIGAGMSVLLTPRCEVAGGIVEDRDAQANRRLLQVTFGGAGQASFSSLAG